MKTHYVKVRSVKHVTHDVLQINTDKPEGWNFIPGQAVDLSIDREGWQEERRPFTFTSLPGDDHLQFTIKTYPADKGVTNELLKLHKDDNLILADVFGAIEYRGEGYFLAGGAGITPFISILRSLSAKNALGDNKLIYANKTREDIILKDEFSRLLGKNFINILSDEEIAGYEHGFITKEFLEKHVDDLNKYFYLCGPPPMMNAVEKILSEMNIDEGLIVKEAE